MGVLTKSVRELRQMIFPRYTTGSGWFSARLGDERDYRALVGNGTGSPLAAACISFIANAFTAMAPMVVRSAADDEFETEPIIGHPAAQLVLRPTYNPDLGRSYYSWHAWIAAMLTSFIGEGMGCSIKVRGAGGAGRPVQLWWTPNSMLEPKWDASNPNSYIDYWQYSPDGMTKVDLPVDDVLCIRDGVNPANTRKGLSKLVVLLREIYTDEEAARWTASLLRNQAVPGVVISPKNPLLRREDAESVVARVERKFTGDRRGLPAVMEGPTDIMQYGFSPEQMKLGDLRDIPEERISAALGIPAAVVGFGAGLQSTKVGATMAELVDLAWQNGILPRAHVFASELTEQLVSDWEDDGGRRVRFVFDTSRVPIMADYQKKIAEMHEIRVRSAVEQRAESRRAQGLPVGPRDKVYLQNSALLEIDATKKPQPPEPVEPKPVAAPLPQLALPAPQSSDAKVMRDVLELASRAFESAEMRTDHQARALVESAREGAAALERTGAVFLEAVRQMMSAYAGGERTIVVNVPPTVMQPGTVQVTVPPTRIEEGAIQLKIDAPLAPPLPSEVHLHIDRVVDRIENHIDRGAVEVAAGAVTIDKGAVQVGIMPPSADIEIIRDAEGRVSGTRRI